MLRLKNRSGSPAPKGKTITVDMTFLIPIRTQTGYIETILSIPMEVFVVL